MRGDEYMSRNNVRVKRSLMLQSFAPLFFLLTIKHLNIRLFCGLISKVPGTWKQLGLATLWKIVTHPSFGSFVVSVLGITWLVLTIIIALGFKGMHTSGFKSAGESVIIAEVQSEGSASFLVTYVLPLLTDDLSSPRALIVFLLMLFMIIALLINSSTYYLNPILAVLKYKVFTFKFMNPDKDIEDTEREYVGITRGAGVTDEATIKRKHISDGVFLIYNA